jgi:serine/threonine-protein kinase
MSTNPDPADDRRSVTPQSAPLIFDPRQLPRLGPYRPQSVLGSGGMATVYLATGATQLGHRRWCALKVLHPKLCARPSYLDMFFNEARIASEISHPHVCGVFDYGTIDGQAYLAMDYVRGKSLSAIAHAREKIADPAEHARRLARLLADACEGLSAIHEHRSALEPELRVVHRDISPDNLLLGFDGFVKVIDFGLAKIDGRGEKTESGILKGKISYVAPELLRGESATASVDIWSLGVVAWELLTGQRLFRRGSDAETVRALAEAPVPPPSSVLPGLPSELDAVVLRALEREPSRRYATAAEFGAALWGFLRAQSKIPDHRQIGAWLSALFPDEEQRLRERLERVPSTPLHSTPVAARRSLHLLQHVRARIAHAVKLRSRARWLAAAVVAGLCFGWSAFHWSNAKTRSSAALRVDDASLISPAFEHTDSTHLRAPVSLTRLHSESGLTVEIERASDNDEVTVRVRASTPNERSSERVTR